MDLSRATPSECQFGKTIRELHTTWFADLGPPFGVMYCIMCECVPFQKKRRVVGRVQCRNIKNECPKPTCDDPILLPGRCCKSCPGDPQSPDVPQDHLPQATMPEEEERSKHFAALLTGRTTVMLLRRGDDEAQYATANPQNVIATGRFSFHKKNLYYSFYVSERAGRPRAIQFVHANGNILEEHTLAIAADAGRFSVYQNTTGKVCGVWRRVPREYRRLLRDELVSVVLLWGGGGAAGNRSQLATTELAIAGPVAKYPALAHELFSALLEPASPPTDSPQGGQPSLMMGAGGTAIVSTSSGATSSIHLTIVLNGLFAPDDVMDVPLVVRLETTDRRQLILEDVQRVRKPSHELNVIELSSPVSVNDLRLLTRGKLALTVESRRNPEALRLHGPVRSRVACEIFQTLLTPHGAELRTEATGLAWMYLNRDGALVYHVQTHHLAAAAGLAGPIITLLDDSAKRKPEIETLTVHHHRGGSVAADLTIGGTIERMGPRLLEPLYAGEMTMSVANEQNLTLLHGKFVTRHVADARDTGAPILLQRPDTANGEPAAHGGHAVGLAWMAVDNECNLHYDLSLAGIPSALHPLQLYLEELPLEAPNAPVSRRLLEDFAGNQLEGFALELPARELAKLETSVIYLEVRSNASTGPLLRSKVRSVTRVPHHCTTPGAAGTGGSAAGPSILAHDNEVQQHNYPFLANDLPTGTVAVDHNKCYHANRFYDDGETWRSTIESCTMCSCDARRIKCDPIRCPPLRCRNEDIIQRRGDCCPSCNGELRARHLSTVGLQRQGCVKESKGTKKPAGLSGSKATGSKDELRDEAGSSVGTLRSPQAILAAGGCRYEDQIYENGQEYHPILATHGEEKCIKCRCKDGQLNCNRKRCGTRPPCPRPQSPKRTGLQQQQQPVDECCPCRPTRHHRKRQQTKEQQANVKS
uniref:VWFC domain-containing protein n=1 Tax=Anopheles albimanus TaxID=7167 RepID=A0A182FME1_ANOAL